MDYSIYMCIISHNSYVDRTSTIFKAITIEMNSPARSPHSSQSPVPVRSPLDMVDIVVPLTVGQEFDSFHDFKAAVYQWAVNCNHSVRLQKSDRKRNLFCCKIAVDCEFKVRAIWKANKEKVSWTSYQTGIY
jgi:hypothetical protein